jgi:hypothetical protein
MIKAAFRHILSSQSGDVKYAATHSAGVHRNVAATDGQSITSGYGRMQVDFNEYPRGVITFTVVGIDYQVDGTWKVDWRMP